MGSEKLWRARVANTIKQQFPGAQVIVLSQRFKAGLPDLFVQAPGYPGIFIELKWMETRAYPPYKLELSALQRKFIRDMNRAGGDAGWVLGVRRDGGPVEVFAGTHTNLRATIFDKVCVEKVDTRAILDKIGGKLYGGEADHISEPRHPGDRGHPGFPGPV